jgi:hypothetical protein
MQGMRKDKNRGCKNECDPHETSIENERFIFLKFACEDSKLIVLARNCRVDLIIDVRFSDVGN